MIAASPLRPLAPDLWEVEQHIRFGLHVRRRMVVVRLAGGGLWLHSPVPIDDLLARELAALGPVAHVVAPNCFHHISAGATRQRYPAATLWAAPGLADKRRDVSFDRTLAEDAEFGPTLAAVHLRGAPAINEFVFYHAPSRALICTDLVLNIRDEPSLVTRLLFRGLGVFRRPGATWYYRKQTKDPAAMAAALGRVLAWDIGQVVMAHGDVLPIADPGQLRAVLGR
jgi:hypothetical protein